PLVVMPQNTFYRTYGTDTIEEIGNAVIQTADGGFLIAGGEVVPAPIQWWKGNGVLLRTDPNGEVLWRTAIIAPGTHGIEFRDLIINAAGQYVVTGVYSHEWNASPLNDDVFLALYDEAGEEVWSTRIGGPYRDLGNAVRQLPDGGYAVGGSRWTAPLPGAIGTACLARFSSTGDSLWFRTYPGPIGEGQYGFCMDVSGDSGYFLGGHRDYFTQTRVLIMHVDSQGDTIWTRRLDTLDEGTAIDVLATSDGGVLATGYSTATGFSRPFLAKLDASGEVIWSNTYPEVYPGWAYSICETATGYTLAGLTGQYHYMMHGVDFNGELLWSHIIEPEGNYGYGYDIAHTTDGGFVVTGVEVTNTSLDIVLIKTDSVGQITTSVQAQPIAAPLGLRAFPNPTERYLTVEYAMKHADPVVVRILDASGREMQSYQPPGAGSGSLSIDLDGLAMGPFLIEARSERETWVLRAIKL
ncbi:MAG: hypothetical protein WAT74_05075, partial [Flavobacteriales bacterium]